VKNLSFFNIIVFLINNLVAFALLVSYLAWFINPSDLPIAGVIALGVPILMGVNLIFVLYWLILRKRQFFLSTFCLLLGWWHFNALHQFSPKNPAESREDSFRVMSYNVRIFHFPGPHLWHETPPAMERMADSLKPDVFCMQEFLAGGNWVPNFKHKYKYVADLKGFTLAIYSNYKFLDKGEVAYPVKNGGYGRFIYADILRGNDTLRIVNVHLMSVRLKNTDLQTFTQIEDADVEKVKRSAKEIYKRLILAYKTRGIQVESISNFIESSPYPVILCGDFNDTPTSFAYRKLTAQLKDSYVLAGSSVAATHTRFSHYNIPMRIDHIFADARLSPSNWQIVKKVHSDHFPVMVDYELKQ